MLVPSLFLLISILLAFAWAVPIPFELAQKPYIFQSNIQYNQFQISDGYGGDAEVRAASIFKDPLERQSLSRLPYDIYDNIAVMREAVEDADQQSFEGELSIYPLDSEHRQALQVGRVKNLVLLYMAAVQLIKIKKAKDAEDPLRTSENDFDLENASDKLDSLIMKDKENWGHPSRSVQWPLE